MNHQITLRKIGDLLGQNYFIPHYQRGYRWTKQQVEDLLDDLDSFLPKEIPGTEEKSFYCLQPVVVKECPEDIRVKNELPGTWYELIDGQQRLTTIFMILHYANEMWIGKQKSREFNLRYETRSESFQFLKEMKVEDSGTVTINQRNIDFYYISQAYQTIHEWVQRYTIRKGKDLDTGEFQSKLKTYCQVIWYEPDLTSDSIDLFTRLNVGKIPLTNAELIKALFLSSVSFGATDRGESLKIEIAFLWDEMEARLGDPDFWAFVTNRKQEQYQTRIELLLDIISNRSDQEPDALFTFAYFSNESKRSATALYDLWIRIEQYYGTVSEWYRDKDLYHRVGFLVSTGKSIKHLLDTAALLKKDVFSNYLDERIGERVNLDINELSFENDKNKIHRVLLLFNVESIRGNENITERYPFRTVKDTHWSLEHIHAQNSEDFDHTERAPWFKWLDYHRTLLAELAPAESDPTSKAAWMRLLAQIDKINTQDLSWETFSALSNEIIHKFSHQSSYDPHSISNLALLSQPDNAALNNSIFEIKRREIIKMEKDGHYIPLCTRRVFTKYYNDKPTTEHFYFWSADDQAQYLTNIKETLKKYLPSAATVN